MACERQYRFWIGGASDERFNFCLLSHKSPGIFSGRNSVVSISWREFFRSEMFPVTFVRINSYLSKPIIVYCRCLELLCSSFRDEWTLSIFISPFRTLLWSLLFSDVSGQYDICFPPFQAYRSGCNRARMHVLATIRRASQDADQRDSLNQGFIKKQRWGRNSKTELNYYQMNR